jgi:hypothetical protein
VVPIIIRRDAEFEMRIGEAIVRDTVRKASAQWDEISYPLQQSVQPATSVPQRVQQHGIIGVKETTE